MDTLNQEITHPSHPYHRLILTPTPAYTSGQFICDSCNIHSTGYSYHCSTCNFDLCLQCVIKPLIKNHNLHPHQLHLTFAPPYISNTFSCDVCHHLGTSQWLYRCAPCQFDVHLDCPSATQQSQHGVLQSQRQLVQSSCRSPAPATATFPATAPSPATVTFPAAAAPYPATVTFPAAAAPSPATVTFPAAAPPPATFPAAAPPPSTANNQSLGDSMMKAAVLGFIGGTFTEVGHNFSKFMFDDY
ncbi:uncharacterized protein LOC124941101 [Impatiens glandulifera]|uniref:uncharacterized protein LOC124941101 n=1 Tax=Impatiens glandulifera TaxID=253017 RepID=UPI001FB19DEB|nr:uncharacterized protein LOC124941101 [Impatiens glandulifera]